MQRLSWNDDPWGVPAKVPFIPAPRFWKHYDELKTAEKKFAAAFVEQGASFTPGKHLVSTRGEFFEADLSGTPLRDLRFQVTDVKSLAASRSLSHLVLPKDADGIEALRPLFKAGTLGYDVGPNPGTANEAAADFWRKYDAKQAAGKK